VAALRRRKIRWLADDGAVAIAGGWRIDGGGESLAHVGEPTVELISDEGRPNSRHPYATSILKFFTEASMLKMRYVVTAFLLIAASALLVAQDTHAAFDVVSIKRNTSGAPGNNIRTLPDGTFAATNVGIPLIVRLGIPTPASVPMLQIVGLPGWTQTERYDITAKPPDAVTKLTTEQRSEMWHSVLVDRLKLRSHVEDRQRNTYALVLARSDRKLGPQLKPSTLDCNVPAPDLSSTPPPQRSEAENRCGVVSGLSSVRSGGTTMEELVARLPVGARVYNRTGLEGYYAIRLDFQVDQTQFPLPKDHPLRSSSDLPDIFTAVQEQLGLKLVPQRTKEPVFVVDHIERPTEN